MTNLRNELTGIVENAEKVLGIQISLLLEAQESHEDNDRLLFLYSQSVEMASYFYYMAKASRGLAVYVSEGDSDFARSDVYDAFQAIDHIYVKAPNERSKIARDNLLQALDVLKEGELDQIRELAGTFGQISDTARLSLLEHYQAITQELGAIIH